VKKANLIILILTAVYSFLFYEEHAGLNFLLFSLTAGGSLAALKPEALKERSTLAVAGLYLLSAVCVLIYSSALSILANIISLLLLSACCFNNRASVLFNLFYSVYSVLGGLVFMVINLIQPEKKNEETEVKKSKLRSLTYIVPVLFGLIFFFLYKSANPLFEKYTEELNLDFISASWLMFTICGFLVAYGLIKHQRIQALDNWENNIPTRIVPSEKRTGRWDERKAAVILFILLNLMLVFMNLLDLNYLYLGAGMPQGVTHKQFVHNGVGMLILSVSLAIVLILYFFRGRLNFEENSKLIKILVYVWIAQNMMMVVSTAIRNNMYVSDALLTYKRIGVYYWLLMAAFGLLTTFIMIRNTRSGWYLFKTNSWIAYVVLVLSACVDWDKVTGDYNISHTTLIASLDKKYLLDISEANIPLLYDIKDQPGFEVDSSYHYRAGYSSMSNTQMLDEKLYFYLAHMEKDSWKSFSYRKKRVLHEVTALNAVEKISSLDLSGSYIHTLKPVYFINNIKALNVSQCMITALSEFNHFKKLRRLSMDHNRIPSLDSLPGLKELTYLSVNDNDISGFAFIEGYKSLQVLHMNENNIQDINDLPESKSIKELTLSNNPVIDLRPLNRLPNLEKLELNSLPEPVVHFPSFGKLRSLELRSSNRPERTMNSLGILTGLESLDISNNSLYSLNHLLNISNADGGTATKFPKLKHLMMHNNELDNLTQIALFPEIETLDVSSNRIRSASGLAQLKKLVQLFIGSNMLDNIDFLKELPQLTWLDISNNKLLSDFAGLKNLRNLEVLDLSSTRFNDLSFINSYRLKNLSLADCRLGSLKGLEKQKQLRVLSVSYVKPTDITVLKQVKTLKELHLVNADYQLIQQLQKELPQVKVTGN
jgi:Leucine-rich repeat (LRR) protein